MSRPQPGVGATDSVAPESVTPTDGRTAVVATAGHVDHGKSTLVRALTGINPDRLREEQEREMTIDLGFAWLDLPSQDTQSVRSVGLVDVPGHIDFIENMLAGVGGIDAALIVVAADEGPMPQTHEHLAILDLLRVPSAVVALTKIDLAPDAEWVDLVRADVERMLGQTSFAGAPIVPVSARTRQGIPELLDAVQTTLQTSPRRQDSGRPRLPVDRVFTITGFGTVVTGTLTGGSLAIGDEVEVLPQRVPARVRGLQTHKHQLDRALPGSRVAANLSGVDVGDLARGNVVASPGWLRPSTRIDVQVEMLSDDRARRVSASRRALPLKHNAEVKLFSGTSETVAHIRLLEGSELTAGAVGWAQLELASPVAVMSGDRFILRLPSPSVTLGGGTVVDPHPAGRHRRRSGRVDDTTLTRLAALLQGTPAQRIESALARLGFATRGDAAEQAGLSQEAFSAAWAELLAASQAREAGDVIALSATWHSIVGVAAERVRAHHAAQPLAAGMPRESLRSKLQLPPRVFNAVLHVASADQILVDEGEAIRLPEFRVRFSSDQQRAVDMLLAQFRKQPWTTPPVKECRAAVGDAVYDVLLRDRRLVQVSPDVVFLCETYDEAVQRVKDIIGRDGQITAAQLRDAVGTTRKYALGLLEHLDQIGVTKRVGDARVLK